MAKRKSSSPYTVFTKKLTPAALIALLLTAIYQLVGHPQHDTSQVPQQQVETKLPSSQDPVALYANQTQDDLTRLYQQAIDSAHESITFVIYALLDEKIIQALQKKSDEGIPVYIVCDAKASPGITRSLPKATIVRRVGNGLMHQKILIIDNQKVIFGSANMTYSSLNVHGNLVIGIDNPALAEALTARAKSMDEDGGVSPMLHRTLTAGPQNVEVWVLPDDPEAVKRMLSLFQSAKKSIRVAIFTFTRMDFVDELINAKKRGVQVEVVVDRYAGKGAGAKVVDLLQKSGIPVTLSTGKGLLHHKFAYIDEITLVNGSANWTHNAFAENDDFFVVVSPLTPQQQAKMNQLWEVVKKQSAPPGEETNEKGKKKKKESFPYQFPNRE